ncbi:unnamed protein product [Urochloa humidicola]
MAAAGGSSRFAATCGLLRQYMREQQQPQQLGGLDAALRLPPLVETTDNDEDADGRTMQLFPTRAGTFQPSQERQEEQAKAPLTIMYEGRVLVFEDFPADKAEELMQIAGSGSSAATAQNKGEPAVQEKPAALPDLPIARKASLQRFLQKRKHRISTTEPYNKVTAASPVPEKEVAGSGKPAASWLGL